MIGAPSGRVFESNCIVGKPVGVVYQDLSPNQFGSSVKTKAGIVSPSAFLGTPKTFVVVFANPFQNTNYSIVISGEDSRIFTYQSKTANGFTINANSNGALTGEVSWIATTVGETT